MDTDPQHCCKLRTSTCQSVVNWQVLELLELKSCRNLNNTNTGTRVKTGNDKLSPCRRSHIPQGQRSPGWRDLAPVKPWTRVNIVEPSPLPIQKKVEDRGNTWGGGGGWKNRPKDNVVKMKVNCGAYTGKRAHDWHCYEAETFSDRSQDLGTWKRTNKMNTEKKTVGKIECEIKNKAWRGKNWVRRQ